MKKTDTSIGRALSILTDNSDINKLCGELLANYPLGLVQSIFMLRGYIFAPFVLFDKEFDNEEDKSMECER